MHELTNVALDSQSWRRSHQFCLLILFVVLFLTLHTLSYGQVQGYPDSQGLQQGLLPIACYPIEVQSLDNDVYHLIIVEPMDTAETSYQLAFSF